MNIEAIISLLNADEHYGISETIDIAKGKNKLPETLREGFKQVKRLRHGR